MDLLVKIGGRGICTEASGVFKRRKEPLLLESTLAKYLDWSLAIDLDDWAKKQLL